MRGPVWLTLEGRVIHSPVALAARGAASRRRPYGAGLTEQGHGQSRTASTLQAELTLGMPSARGLYDPRFEHDSCGVGFVCDIKGVARNRIVRAAEHINCCMVHRGGVGYEKTTGDGAGILTALPHKLFAKFSKRQLKQKLPKPGRYGAGNVFLPRDIKERQHCKNVIEERIRAAGPDPDRLAQGAGRPRRCRPR